MSELAIRNLHVSIENKEILKGLNLVIPQGEIHAIMGPNGTGKSTLAYTIMGHPAYTVTEGEICFNGNKLLPYTTFRVPIFLSIEHLMNFCPF